MELARLTSESDENIQRILDERNAKNTNRATRSCMTQFREYVAEKNLPLIENIKNEDLPENLFKFYLQCHKTDGDDYKLQSLKCLRAGINRYMKAEHGIDIISNEAFVKANEIF